MASTLGVVKAEPVRILSHAPGRGSATTLEGLSPDASALRAWLDSAVAAAGDAHVKRDGVLLEYGTAVALFDRRYAEIAVRLGVPVVGLSRAPNGFRSEELPGAEFVELKYAASRPWADILDDVYAQAVQWQEKSRKRELGTVLRVWDRRGAVERGGFLVQLEAVARAGE